MSVKVNIHPYLKHLADNNDFIMVEGKNIGECLEEVTRQYPELDEWFFNKERGMNPMFEVYLNMGSPIPEGLAMPVKSGDAIDLIITISGG